MSTLTGNFFLDKKSENLSNFDNPKFDIFEMVREVKSRELVLPMMTMHAVQSLKLIDKIDDIKLGNFLAKV